MKGSCIRILAFILYMGPNISKLLEALFSLKFYINRGPIIFVKASFISFKGLEILYMIMHHISVGQGGPIIIFLNKDR